MTTIKIPIALKRFMSMFDISEHAANVIYNVANIFVVIAAILGGVGAIGLFWAGGVKDKYAELREARTMADIAWAETLASEAHERIAKANLDLEERKQENLKLLVQLEEEQVRRAQLVESVLWRNGRISLSEWWREKFDENMSRALRTNPDDPTVPDPPTVKVSVVCAQQREPMWVAHDLAKSLMHSGFEVTELSFIDEHIEKGIVIQCRVGPSNQNDFRYEAADAIIAGLRGNFVTAHTSPAKLPDNTLRIFVGPSDRLSGPTMWQSAQEARAGVPPHELPPPIALRNEKGESVRVQFPDPSDESAPATDNETE
jgi:hypothetical protein